MLIDLRVMMIKVTYVQNFIFLTGMKLEVIEEKRDSLR